MNKPTQAELSCRHYVSYTGVNLPLKLITPLEDESAAGRITYMRAYYDDAGLLRVVEKMVYGEVEFEHRYDYYDDGRIKSAQLSEPDEEPQILQFD